MLWLSVLATGRRAAIGGLCVSTSFAATAGSAGVSRPLADAILLSDADFYAQFPYRTVADVLPFLRECAREGDPDSVVAALDLWAARYPMYQISATKGAILDGALRRASPNIAVEIGSFIGYSAVRMARALPRTARLVCVEASPDFAEVARSVVAYAGLDATFVVAKASDCVPRLAELAGDDPIDFLFLDHAKEAYLADLQRLEAANLVRNGTVVLADNVRYPGAPGFLDYVVPPRYDTQLVDAPYEAVGWETNWKVVDDAMSISTRLALLSQ
ncbi:hypothetical protein CTAYLR_003393 [Chrysophaeum taylorii]|uniref:catechol O-methyltransferase n=1 Tax=Chrysophaeum taylorii TaxID=2483200 RepID=A0AAD7U8E9_9STRA|nr:hypothetical protein CTAYLR_003393 [Chrysophaeum taylorii]